MKNLIRAITCALMLVAFAGCTKFSNRGTHNLPFIGSANTTWLSFERIELTDSTTVLDCVTHSNQQQLMRISETSIITADGKDYPMVAIDGIKAGEMMFVPDSGVLRFTMTFPAIPAGVKKIDFSENSPNGWKIWDIDLTGKASHTDYSAKLLAKKGNVSLDAPLPKPTIAYGDSTTVRVHLTGYRPVMGDKLVWCANTLHGRIGEDTPATIDEDGNATIRLSIVTPVKFSVHGFANSDNNPLGEALLSPGETADLYVDTHFSGITNMARRDGVEPEFPEGYLASVAVGRYPDLGDITCRKYFGMPFLQQFGDYHMNGDEYTDYILKIYKSLSDSIDSDPSLSPMGREYHHAALTGDLVYAATEAKTILLRNYHITHRDTQGSPEDSVSITLSPENIKAIAANIDFNNAYTVVLSPLFMSLSNTAIWDSTGIDAGFLKTAGLYAKTYKGAEDGAIDESSANELRSVCAPMADDAEAHNRVMRERFTAAASMICKIDENVPYDKIFETIVAPHKGKVVVVDFWNTWCGPCLMALKENEPEKSGDLSSDDIVWIYVADETSLLTKYLSMIGDIKGIHFLLTLDQRKALFKRFNIDAIPFYIMVDRDGNATARPDFRNHALLKKTILEEIAG